MKEKLFRVFTTFVLSLSVWNFAYSQTVEIATPNVAGGAVDITARAISKAFTDAGIDNIVTYHPGGNGDIALRHVLQKRDNVVLVASAATFVFSNITTKRDHSIYAKEMKLVGPTVTNPMAFLSSDRSKTIQDLIAQAKVESIPCGTSNAHGEIELRNINKQFGTKFEPVPHKGTGQLIPNIVGGHLTCAYDQIAPYAKLQDKVKFLATSKPWKNDVVTLDTILPGYSYETWYAAAIPNGSNLLKDSKVSTILATWTKDRSLVQPLLDTSFMLTPATADLNERAERETKKYIEALK